MSRLCDVRLTSVKVSLDLNKVTLNPNGDFATGSLARVMNTPDMNDMVVRTWLDRAASDGRKSTLIFCVDIAHVEALTNAFREVGVDARYLTGKTSVGVRKELVAKFREGEFPVLINCGG
jgi:ATP-dependent helicase IRC3